VSIFEAIAMNPRSLMEARTESDPVSGFDVQTSRVTAPPLLDMLTFGTIFQSTASGS
jgi:hypothetical protein